MHAGQHPHSATDSDRDLLPRAGSAEVWGPAYRHEPVFSMFNINSVSANTWTFFIGVPRTGVWIIKTDMEFASPDLMPEPLLSAIEESRGILELKDNWDGEESPGYSEDTWQRAVNFLVAQWAEFFNAEGRPLELPSILPDSKGSIDLWWDSEEFQLLISFPASELVPASLYGHKHGGQRIEYAFDSSKADRRLVQWMAKVEGTSRKKSLSQKKSSVPT